jgi:DNA polymerase-3 subunit alpha
MTDFTHLHVHSQYSLMDGLCSPAELLQAAKDLGQTSLAITDHGTLSSHRDMQKSAKAAGLKPILGVEAYISETDRFDKRDIKSRDDNTQVFNHLIVLAKDQTGLANLQRLSELAWTEGFYRKPRIDFEILSEYGDGLIVLSGCLNGLICKAIERGDDERARNTVKWFKNRFGDDFYMEVQPHNPPEINLQLLSLADEYGIASVSTSDCHFATKDQRAVEEALLILSTKPNLAKDASYASGKAIKDIFERLNHLYPERPISFQDIDLFIQSRAEMQEWYHRAGIERTDIYENSLAIADKIGDYEYYENLSLLPRPRKSPNVQLRELCDKSLAERGLDSEVYQARLNEELTVIKDKDFASYFLVVADMVQYAKSQDILVGPGRGSAAGSLVCYLLGITQVDPIEYDLLFFRFINPERNDFPDVDTDFADRRRNEVKDYLRKKFKNVASIATFSYFKDKGVIRDASRVFSLPLGDVNKSLKGVETFEEFEVSKTTEWFREKYPEVLPLARELRGRIRGTGMHAAGVVVAKEPISKYAPIETRSDPQDKVSGRVPVVAYDMEQAAEIGLIKLDALGLKTLSVVKDCIDIVKERHGTDIVLTDIPMDDPRIYTDLSNGFTKGVFQAEATPYTNLLIKMGVDNFEDLVASNALVRPGAMNTVGAIYINRKKGREQVRYVHEIMKEFTERTYGVVIYQEQVMQACVHLGGMSWAEADKVRKIIGKKKDAKEFDVFREKFVSGATEFISQEEAEHLWHDFEAHAGYSFNRSHAVAYSMLSYWTAWLKHYYPLEFIFSILRNEGDKDARTGYLLEAKRLGLKVLLPHINKSEIEFTIQNDSIVFGLADIKFLSDKTAVKIIANRPFKSYAELLAFSKTKGSGVNSRAIMAMDAVGAAAFEDNPRNGNESANYYEYLNIPKFDVKGITPFVRSQISPLEDFTEDGCYVLLAMVKSIKKGQGWSRVELVDDTGAIGIFHTENTQIEPGIMYFFLVGDNRIHRYVSIEDVVNHRSDPFVDYLYAKEILAGEGEYQIVDFTNYRTKAGKMMAHVILSDATKELTRIIVFPAKYAEALGKMKVGKVCDITITKMEDGTLTTRQFG